MLDSGYLLIIIGIVMSLGGVLGAVTAGDFQIAGVGVRIVSFFAVPIGLIMLLAGNKLRRMGRIHQRDDALIIQREKQTADARQLEHDERQYPQFEGLTAAQPDIILPVTGRQQPMPRAQKADEADDASPKLGYPATNYDKRSLE